MIDRAEACSWTRKITLAAAIDNVGAHQELGLDQFVTYRIADQVGYRMKVELLHNVAAVGFDGFHADVQKLGYLFVAFPFSK